MSSLAGADTAHECQAYTIYDIVRAKPLNYFELMAMLCLAWAKGSKKLNYIRKQLASPVHAPVSSPSPYIPWAYQFTTFNKSKFEIFGECWHFEKQPLQLKQANPRFASYCFNTMPILTPVLLSLSCSLYYSYARMYYYACILLLCLTWAHADTACMP
jgi:hypothetical protein